MPPHVLLHFVVLPPGHGSSVTDCWGWDSHEAQLRCLHDVSGDIGGWSARSALKPKFYWPTQTIVTLGILPFRENSNGRAGIFFCKNRTLLVLTRYRVNSSIHVPYWSLCGILYTMSPPAAMSPWGNGRCYYPRCTVSYCHLLVRL